MTTAPVYERLWHELTTQLPGHHDNGHPAADCQHHEGTTTMHITDLGAEIRDHVEQAHASLARLVEDKLPALLAEGSRLARSPIAQVLEEIGDVVLPPETEQAIVALIRFAASASTPTVATGDAGDGIAPAEAAIAGDE